MQNTIRLIPPSFPIIKRGKYVKGDGQILHEITQNLWIQSRAKQCKIYQTALLNNALLSKMRMPTLTFRSHDKYTYDTGKKKLSQGGKKIFEEGAKFWRRRVPGIEEDSSIMFRFCAAAASSRQPQP